MDPKHLHYLAEIVRYGSLNRASERLGVVQPTLTRIVKMIEDKAGAPVLRRGRYGVTPTEVGKRLAAVGRAISQQVTDADKVLEQWRAGLYEELRVGVGPMLALTVMPDFLLQSLHQAWPYSMQITTATAGWLVDRLNYGELDVVVAPSQLRLHQEDLHQEIVFEDRMAIFAGRESPLLAKQGPISSGELAEASWIGTGVMANIDHPGGDIIDSLGLKSAAPKLSFTGDMSMALSLLQRSDALVALPENLATHVPAIDERQKLKVDADLPKRDIAIWVTKSNEDHPAIQHFKKALRSHLATFQKSVG